MSPCKEKKKKQKTKTKTKTGEIEQVYNRSLFCTIFNLLNKWPKRQYKESPYFVQKSISKSFTKVECAKVKLR